MGALLLGCGPQPHPSPLPLAPEPQPARVVGPLASLLASPGLRWLVQLRPAELAAISWLAEPIGRVLEQQRLALLTRTTGVALRRAPALALAGYRDDVVAYLVRHRSDQALVERRFRERLTSHIERAELGHQLVGLWGRIGTKPHGFAALGTDVAVYQYGGDRKRGPARIALLYAQGKLDRIPTAIGEASMAALAQGLGPAPAMVLLPGPFEGQLARGVRGLLGAATAFGASLTPTQSQTLKLRARLAGVLSASEPSGERAGDYLEASWNDLASSDLGHLLHLHEPRSSVEVATGEDGLSLAVELDPHKLFDGLAAATLDDVRALMRTP